MNRMCTKPRNLFTLLILALFSFNLSAQTLSCLDEINANLDPNTCTVEITADMLIFGLESPDGYTVEIMGQDDAIISRVGTYTASVIDDATGNKCWGTVIVQDKVAPILTCPDDVEISCADPSDPESIYAFILENSMETRVDIDYNGSDTAAIWGVGVIECSPFHLTYVDDFRKGNCVADTIYRTFRAIDYYGLVGECVQEIVLLPQTLDNIALPDDFDCLDGDECDGREFEYGTVDRSPVLACDGAGTVWNVLENGHPSPYNKYDSLKNIVAYGTGIPGGASCGTINYGYKDVVVDICNENCTESGNSFKVIREWTIIDWCNGTIVEHNQIIKIMDTIAPEFVALPDVTISTNLWNCEAEYALPQASVTDNCSENIHVSWGASEGYIEDGILYIENKTMEDTAEVYVYYSDCCGNVATDTFKLTVQDLVPPVVVADAHTVVSLSDNYSDGLAKIFAESFDNGSWDNCSNVELKVKRMGGTCSGFGEEDDKDKWFDFVHFCCKDIGKETMVILRACDDASMDGLYGNENDNCNTVMISVDVQDKLPPACKAPADMVISCIEAGTISDLIGKGTLRSSEERRIEALFGEADGAATCKVDIEQELISDDECGMGTITRKITVTNENNGLSTVCYQYIRVTYDRNVNFLTCDDISFPTDSKEYEVFTKYIKDNYTKDDVPPYPDQVWCLMNPYNIGDLVDEGADLPAIEVDDCAGVSITQPLIDITNLCSEVGMSLTLDTFEFAGGGCKKILAHWEIIDQCLFVENFNLCDYYNNDSRYSGDCEINPFVPENGYFEMYVEYDLFDDIAPEVTCGDGYVVDCDGDFTEPITASATDNCTDPEFFGWTWKLDVDSDGTYEFSGEGNSISPADITMDAFPIGTHAVTWSVSDGCGNFGTETCEFTLGREDTKAPTPYCHDGLATAVMGTDGTVTIWASDFDAGSYDNCSPVTVSIVPESEVAGLNRIDAFLASLKRINGVYGWTFDCSNIPNGVSSEIEVRMYAFDQNSNFDYCVATLSLVDNLGGCPDSEGLVAIGGNISTVYDDAISNVEVKAMTTNPEYPVYTATDGAGMYNLYNNPAYLNYEVAASKNTNYMEGVSTLDLILIQKHILGIQPLDNPYKLIAADINNDNAIKASDLLSLRKLILGYYANDELPNNSSWVFLSKNYTFTDESNPFDFPSMNLINQLEEDAMHTDFYGVKIGDVTYQTPGKGASTSQTRSNQHLIFNYQNANLKAGDLVEVPFTSENFDNVFGYQFALNVNSSLEIVKVESGALEVDMSNFGIDNNGNVLTSYHNARATTTSKDEVLFTLTVKANEDLVLSDVLNIEESKLSSEAYVTEDLETRLVKIESRNGETIDETNEFVVYQNEPNPFKNRTTVGFNLPEAGNAILSVFDVTGKLLFRSSKSYAKGYNSEVVENLETTGVLYYQVESNEFSATKKMVVIE